MDWIASKIQHYANLLLHSKFYFIWLPLFVAFLGFFETVGIFGFFIPMEIIAVTYFAFIHSYLYVFIAASIVFAMGVFLGLIVGYFIWKKFYNKIISKIENKFPATKEYFEQIDKYMEKYHFWMFPLLINVGYTRPIMALHLWWRNYNFRKYIIGSFVATLAYVVPRVVIWYLIGVFGKVILEYLKIWYKYIVIFVIIAIVVYFIYDIIKESKELKK